MEHSPHLVADLTGGALTLLVLLLLAAGGYLAACRLLGGEARRDPLALLVATLLLVLGQAVGLGLLLGAVGLLRLDLALGAQAILTLGFALEARSRGVDVEGPLRLVSTRLWARLRERPALALLTLHGVGSEALRGLLLPPLSWDSLAYHLLLAARWLQEGSLAPVLGAAPLSYYAYVPANGSVWLWWWLAPVGSELFVNLASFPHLALLGLAAGGLARELGARRHWPLAAYLTVLTPVILRFAAAQYVDLLLASCLLAALFFGLRWAASARGSHALLAGIGLGLAAGTKVLGLPYGAAAAVALLAAAGGSWRGSCRRRVPQVAAAAVLALALGGFFYARNAAFGVGPLALECLRATFGGAIGGGFPGTNSILADPAGFLARGVVGPVFLGITRPGSAELGIGPQALLLLAAFLTLPFGPPGRRAPPAWWVAWGMILVQLGVWLTVPTAASWAVFANVRYLTAGIGLAFAAAVTQAETRGIRPAWIAGLAVALAVQDLLMLRSELSYGVRIAIALADLGALALGLSAPLRGALARRWRPALAVALAAGLAAVPPLAAFRRADRARAFAEEAIAHPTFAPLHAGAWEWLADHGGEGATAISGAPATYFVYPAMGMRLSRPALYVNVNRADLPHAGAYPGCEPRADADPEAWLANLADERVRWVLVSRFPGHDFPVEAAWAEARPAELARRWADENNRIYEVIGGRGR